MRDRANSLIKDLKIRRKNTNMQILGYFNEGILYIKKVFKK